MAKKLTYTHSREGIIVKVEIKDETYRTIYKTKFNIRDKNAILNHLRVLEEMSGFNVVEIIKQKLKIGEWF